MLNVTIGSTPARVRKIQTMKPLLIPTSNKLQRKSNCHALAKSTIIICSKRKRHSENSATCPDCHTALLMIHHCMINVWSDILHTVRCMIVSHTEEWSLSPLSLYFNAHFSMLPWLRCNLLKQVFYKRMLFLSPNLTCFQPTISPWSDMFSKNIRYAIACMTVAFI